MIPWFDSPRIVVGPVAVEVAEGLAIAGAVAALVVAHRRARQANLSVRRAVDGMLAIIVCGVVFGHVVDVLLYRVHEWQRDGWSLLPWAGGFASAGALLGVAIAVALFFRAPGGLRWRELDHAAVALLVGLGVLRVGCFLGHHHAGRLSGFVLAVGYPGGARHDLGLYEAVLAFGILTAVRVGERWMPSGRPGLVCGGVVLAYALGRFAIEVLRATDLERIGRHSDPRYAGLTLVQYAMIALAITGAGVLRARARAPA